MNLCVSSLPTLFANPFFCAGVVPHKILYATGLPPEITQIMLAKLFEQYPGFTEVSRFRD